MNTEKIQKRKIHEKPRCSINKLGEYVATQSSPARRREIVKSQKIPPTFKTVTYTPATKNIVEYIMSGFDNEMITDKIAAYFEKSVESTNDFDKKQAKCCQDALKSFRKLIPHLDLEGCTAEPGPQTWSIVLGGVTVSVRPELFLRVTDRRNHEKIGFIKIYASKGHRLDDHAAGIIAAVIIAKAKESLPAESIVSTKHVLILDVFGERVYTAPVNTKKLLNEATAACEEIAFSWERF